MIGKLFKKQDSKVIEKNYLDTYVCDDIKQDTDLGVKIIDVNLICTTDTKCTIIGPYIGVTAYVGLSATTGSASLGKVILAIGKGIEFSGTLNSDGSYTIGGEGKTGMSAGTGIIVCVKETTNSCISKGK